MDDSSIVEMTPRRALALSIMAINDVIDRYDMRGIVEWYQAAEVVRQMLEEIRNPVRPWFYSPGRYRGGGGRHRSEY